MTWVEQEFRRTGLPRTALARYLERHKPVISLITRGERHVSPEEADLIRSFFSVVPPSPDARFVAAVESLKSTKVRNTVGLNLVRWFERVADEWPYSHELAHSFLQLLKPVSERRGVLRADQIVAICRVANIDLVAMCGGRGETWERLGERPIDATDAISALDEGAERWMREYRNVRKYDFNRGDLFEPIGHKQDAKAAALQVAESSIADFSECEAFLLIDDKAKPFFEAGQTIFMSRTKPQRGDFVAAVMSDEKSSGPTAIIGRLAYDSQAAIAVETAHGQQKLDKKSYLELRRIDFCRF